MAPIVHGLEAEYSGKIKFAYIDIDDPLSEEFKSALGFRYQPQFFLLDGEGNIIKQWAGSVPAEDFRAVFDEYVTQ